MFNLLIYFPLFQYIFAFYFSLILFSSSYVLLSANSVFSVLSLVVVFILTSFIFVMLGGDYLGLIYVIVYVGAIAILFLFVLMLLNVRYSLLNNPKIYEYFLTFFNILVIECFIYYYAITPLSLFFSFTDPAQFFETIFFTGGDTSILFVGRVVFNIFFYYLIFCAFILLFIMVGVVLLLNLNLPEGKKKNVYTKNKILQDYLNSLRIAKIQYDFQRK